MSTLKTYKKMRLNVSPDQKRIKWLPYLLLDKLGWERGVTFCCLCSKDKFLGEAKEDGIKLDEH